MPSQPFSLSLGVPSHHVFLLSLNKMQYCLTNFMCAFLWSVLQTQTSSNVRMGHFLNHDFVSPQFPTANEGSKERFFWDLWLFIPFEHPQSLRETFLFFINPSTCLRTSGTPCLLLGVFQFALRTRCPASYSVSPITLWARKSVLFSLFYHIAHWIFKIRFEYIYMNKMLNVISCTIFHVFGEFSADFCSFSFVSVPSPSFYLPSFPPHHSVPPNSCTYWNHIV